MKRISRGCLLSTLAIGAMAPVAGMVSCNIRQGREVKNNKLDSSIWESAEWKTLQQMIQNKFKKLLITDMFTDYVYYNTSPAVSSGERDEWGLSEVTEATTKQEIDRIFLEKKQGVGNYATDQLDSVFQAIRANKLIPPKYKLLLNQINTIYNRTINVYPTKIYPKKIDGENYMHIEFRVDLLTPMKRRFVRKFLDLKLDFPIFDRKYNQANLRKFYKITQLADPVKLAREITTGTQMRNLWLSTIRTDKGIRPVGNGIIDVRNAKDLLGTQQLLNLNSGFYPLNAAKNDLYNPAFTGRISDPLAPQTYDFANWHGDVNNDEVFDDAGNRVYLKTRSEANRQFIALKNTDKVSQLEEAIRKQFFTNSKMPLFKALFGSEGHWSIMVQAQTWAGNPASNYTIADWVENIGHRSNFLFYMINDDDPSESYYYKTTAGMAKVQEVG